eukprot:5602314-Amphidinium_carterae.1
MSVDNWLYAPGLWGARVCKDISVPNLQGGKTQIRTHPGSGGPKQRNPAQVEDLVPPQKRENA